MYPLRLLPGMEIKKCLIEFVKSNELSAAFIITCCGSVKSVTLRYATGDNQEHKVHIYDVHKLVVLHSLLIKEGLDKRGVLTWTLRLAIIHWSVRRRGGGFLPPVGKWLFFMEILVPKTCHWIFIPPSLQDIQ